MTEHALQRREYERVTVALMGLMYRRCGHWKSAMPIVCYLKNLSANGAKIVCSEQFRVGDSFALVLKQQYSEVDTTVYGDIVRLIDELTDEGHAYGVRLYTPEREISAVLKGKVQEHLDRDAN